VSVYKELIRKHKEAGKAWGAGVALDVYEQNKPTTYSISLEKK